MYIADKKAAEASNSNILSFSQLWLRYFAYWPLFVLLLVVAAAAAWLYLWHTPPMYESEAKILINDEKKGSEDSKSVEAFTLLDPKKIIENETEVVQSRTLVDKVVKDLSLYAPVYEQHKFRSTPAYTTSPIKIEASDLAAITETGKIAFTYDSIQSVVNIGSNKYALNSWVSTPMGLLKFTNNAHYMPGASNSYYFQLVNPKKITFDIQDRLKVASVSKLSTILDITIKDAVPQRGDDILNSLLDNYNKQILNEKNALAANTLGFVQQRLNSVTKNLDSIEARIQSYKSSNTAVDIGTQGRLFLENVSSNDQKISDINIQLAVLDNVQAYVESKENSGGIVPSTLGVNDLVLSQLVNKLYETELEYEKIKNIEGANYPTVIALVDQIQKLKPSILENIKSQRQSLEASKTNLATTNNSYSQSLQSIPEKERQLIDINRDQAIKNSTYAFLLQKREETALSNAANVTDNRIVDLAQSSVLPVSPKGTMIYGIFLAAALVLGITLITIKETFSSKVLYRYEIESLTKFPVVGEIAYEKAKTPFVTKDGRASFVSEQFRQLRVALSFLSRNSKKKKILITSSIPGEGKSFIATNLALTLAATNKRVVLVELDLSNPVISARFNTNAAYGVTDYLQLQCKEGQLAVKTNENDNLFIISAGSRVNNPSELLDSDKIGDLIKYLEITFDYVIIDTPPVNLVTDAYLLSAYCDVTLYIVRHNYTQKLLVQRIEGNNKISKLKNIAIVFNGVHARGFVKNGYGYGYGYGYTYNDRRNEKFAS